MNPVDRAIAAMIHAAARHPPESAAREPRGVTGATPARQPATVALAGRRAFRSALPLFAIVALNAALLGGFVWSTASAADRASGGSSQALAKSGSPAPCACAATRA